MFFAKQTPFAVLLDGVSRRDKAIPGKTVIPVIKAQNGLEVGQRNKGV
jgi:hypothetical protein